MVSCQKKSRNVDSCIVRDAKVSISENDEGQVGNGGEREGFGNDERKALLELEDIPGRKGLCFPLPMSLTEKLNKSQDSLF